VRGEADELHQYIAVNELVGGVSEVAPEQAAAVMFGEHGLGLIDGALLTIVMSAWRIDRSSLRAA
jgi:hypothetical protein